MEKLFIFSIVFLIIPANAFVIYPSEILQNDCGADGEIFYVGGSGPNNYSSIQSAINDADDSDTIFVYNGTYFENILIDKKLHIIGEDKNDTIIDGSGIGNIVDFSADFINFCNFTIQHSGDEYANSGVIFNSNNCSLTNVIIIETYWAIYLTHFSERNEIKNNFISNNTRGIYSFTGCKYNFISFNTIINNIYSGIFFYATEGNIIERNILNSNGNGVVIDFADNNLISQNKITNNTYSGIILTDSSNYNQVSNNSISDHYLSGIYLGDNSSHNNISYNYINLSEDGIGFENSQSNIIYNNFISSSSYSGISLTESSQNLIEKNTIQENKNYGLYLYDSDNNIIDSNNIIRNDNYGIYLAWSNNNIIRRNLFNLNHPLHLKFLSVSNNNWIYLNNFLNNSCNISDFCNNIWDFEKKGNYWSDYEDRYPEAQKLWFRGTWDTPYDIPGGKNQDRYPLIKEWQNTLSTTFNTINKSLKFHFNLLGYFFESFPNAFPILRQLPIFL